jgi:CheY-like chemotaxis protein
MLEAPYILLAEDSDDDSFFAQRCLAASGQLFKLRRCSNGNDLIHELQSCGIDLPAAVILDLKMPLMDGFETLDWIRRQAAYAALPVIILSSSALAEDQERARALGASEYLVKPGSLADLERLLKDLAARIAAGFPLPIQPPSARIPPRP